MELHVRVIAFLLFTACRGSGQTHTAQVNTLTSLQATNDNSLTNQASQAFNPPMMSITSLPLAAQTSGYQDASRVLSIVPTSSDYRSNAMTPSHVISSGLETPSSVSLQENLNIISVPTSPVPQSEAFPMSVFIAPSQTIGVSLSSPEVSVRERSNFVLTSTPQSELLFNSVSVTPVSSSTLPLQPSSTSGMLESSSDVVGYQRISIESASVHNTVPSLSVIQLPGSSFRDQSSSITGPEIVQSSMESSSLLLPGVSSEVQGQYSEVEPSYSEIPSLYSEILTAYPAVQTSDFEVQPSNSDIKAYSSSLVLESVEISRESSVPLSSIVWGPFMDKISYSQVTESMMYSQLSSQILPVFDSESVWTKMSSSQVQPDVVPSFVNPSSSSQIVSSVVSETFVVASRVVSTEMPEIGSPVSSPEIIPNTQSSALPIGSEVVSSHMEPSSELGPMLPTSQPVFWTSSVSQLQTDLWTMIPVGTSTMEYVSRGEITHVSSSSRVTVLESVAPSSTSVPDQTKPVSSESILPTKTEFVSQSSVNSSVVFTTSTIPPTTPSLLRDCYFQLTFDVECTLILNNSLVLAEFVGSLQNTLVVNLNVPESKIKLYDPVCGSIIIHVGFTQVPYKSMKHTLFTQFSQNQFEVPIMVNNQWLKLLGVKVIEIDAPTTFSPIEISDSRLDKVDLIVIIVACCVCGILITIGIILCGKECYRRKYAQSFDLLEVPHVNLKLEDFTLTRIPRPKAVYDDGSVTMKAYMDNNSHRIVKNNGVHDNQGIKTNDVHVRMKENKDGLVVGVTGYSSQKNGVTDKGVKKNSSMRSSEHRPGDPATENLLQKPDSAPMGAHNPIFVDDESVSNSTTDDSSKKE